MKKLPSLLAKQTILDAISEIKFDDAEDIEILFSGTYNILKKQEWEFEKMPIMSLSPEIRKNDETFRVAPHYKFNKNNINIFIGPSLLAFSLSGLKSYKGWDSYRSDLDTIISDLKDVFFHLNIKQVSMQYIDFFKDLNIFDKLEITIEDKIFTSLYTDIVNDKKYTRSFISGDKHITTNIDNGVALSFNNSEEVVEGSIIDIEIAKTTLSNDLILEFDEIHENIKRLFFELLKDDFIASLHPEYK